MLKNAPENSSVPSNSARDIRPSDDAPPARLAFSSISLKPAILQLAETAIAELPIASLNRFSELA
jgi:hypothetical protein